MANPQCEKGYTRFANELLEAMCHRISNSTWIKILLYTGRITYGWRRKEAESNYQAYATKTGLNKDTIKSNMLDMNDRRIITLVVISPERFVVTINKDYEKWKI